MSILNRFLKKSKKNSNFIKINDIRNGIFYPNLFKDGELISITEKVSGTFIQAGYTLTSKKSIRKKFLRLFGVIPKWTFIYGDKKFQYNNIILKFIVFH